MFQVAGFVLTDGIATMVTAVVVLATQLFQWRWTVRKRKYDAAERAAARDEMLLKFREANLERAVDVLEHSRQVMAKLVEVIGVNRDALKEANGTNAKIARLHEEFKQAVEQPKLILTRSDSVAGEPHSGRGKLTTGRKK